jgi:predicted dehydrogenase
MSKPVTVTLFGLGGYGEVYLAALSEEIRAGRCRLLAGVDPAPERCSRRAELEAQGVPIHTAPEMLDALPLTDLVIVSSPIHRHCPQTCWALARGSHVLCEKPVAATVQEVDQMIAARDQVGRYVAIGYQWSFLPTIQRLKQDIQAGRFGAPRRLKSLCLWPRDAAYYGRNDWAGRIRDAEGRWILDSPANNAMAHDLHNMLYLLGDRQDRSAQPVHVTAETYRANAIENFDTMAMRVHTTDGVEILFFGSHAIADEMGPIFRFEFTQAVVEYAGGTMPIVARHHNGTRQEYGSPLSEPHMTKLTTCLAAAAGGPAIPCGLEAARSHMLCINGVYESTPPAAEFPNELIGQTGTGPRRVVHVRGLAEVLHECYDRAALPSELAVPWARAGREVALSEYHWFPGGQKPGSAGTSRTVT